MPKKKMQVSKDQGDTWKYRWVDPAEIKPEHTILELGDWVRANPESQVFVIGIRKGMLYSFRLEHAPCVYTYTLDIGQSFSFQTLTKEEADILFIAALKESGILRIDEKMLVN
ncbi:hypothetical protein [Paenibacillus pasadenensis]|uniref:hypothetical protein n=1 Tax=Paenibacillus pasadenensis TaxID=217090 RepID=UPI0011AF9C77|nr:hypothetical protein [Paenibacillus pasadenensis]